MQEPLSQLPGLWSALSTLATGLHLWPRYNKLSYLIEFSQNGVPIVNLEGRKPNKYLYSKGFHATMQCCISLSQV